MKKALPFILSGASCLLAGACLLELHGVKSQLNALKGQNSQYYSMLQNGIGDISATVSDQLTQQQSLLAQSSYTYGAVDAENATVELHYTAVPKEYTPGITVAEFHANGTSVPMAYENGQFTAVISLPLFSGTEGTFLTLQDGDSLRTQAIDEYFNPQYQVMPDIYVNGYGSSSCVKQDGTLVLTEEQPYLFTFNSNSPDSPKVQSIDFVIERNGGEIDRIPVDLTPQGQAELAASKLWQNVNAQPEMADGGGYYAVLDTKYPLPAGQNLRVYADVELENGLLCRMLLDSADADKDGNVISSSLDSSMEFWGQPRYIYYAPTHKLLWDAVLGEAH